MESFKPRRAHAARTKLNWYESPEAKRNRQIKSDAEQKRRASEAYKKRQQNKKPNPVYMRKRWRDLRAWFLRRHPLCAHCQQEGVINSATHVDHITPHNNDEALLYDPGNLQALCASHHSTKTMNENRDKIEAGRAAKRVNPQ